jgi:UDP-glucose 6-dehydrogenase
MKILYIGGGFVGACSAAVSADSGHTVMVYDVDKHKVAKLSSNDPKTIQSAHGDQGVCIAFD